MPSLKLAQISEDHVSNVEDHLHIGQDVQVRVIDVDVDNCRLGLSMREPRQGRRQSGGGSRGGKKDVSALLGRDPEEFVSGRVRCRVLLCCFLFYIVLSDASPRRLVSSCRPSQDVTVDSTFWGIAEGLYV